MPVMRCHTIAFAAAAVLLVAACDAVTSTAAKYNPFISFETRCGRLPPSRIDIRQQPVVVTVNDELPQRALTRLGEGNPDTHRTLGLTRTQFRQQLAIELNGLSDGSGKRSCARPSVVLDLSMAPLTVYIASELRGNDCGYAAVQEHEMKHVAAFREHLAASARRLGDELPRVFGQRVINAADAQAGEAEVQRALQEYLNDFKAASTRELELRQAAVDSDEEYARVNGACGGVRVN
jgi:hypothetical protein